MAACHPLSSLLKLTQTGTREALEILARVGLSGAATEVHRQLGPGLLESIYLECLCRELAIRGIRFIREVALPVIYKGLNLECGYRLDLLVNDEVVVELKSVEFVLPVHKAQLMTYLNLTGKKVGLLINFNVPVLTEGITRRML